MTRLLGFQNNLTWKRCRQNKIVFIPSHQLITSIREVQTCSFCTPYYQLLFRYSNKRPRLFSSFHSNYTFFYPSKSPSLSDRDHNNTPSHPLGTKLEDYVSSLSLHPQSFNEDTTDTPSNSQQLSSDAPDYNFPLSNELSSSSNPVDWSKSYQGLSVVPFDKQACEVLLQPISPQDIEIKPDGIIYLPEIKYRRILNQAFGPGAWGLVPRGETTVTSKLVTREYALIVLGRLVSIARGEQQYFDIDSIPTATEGCKSNALMRCCKDLGIASELWDPVFIRDFLAHHAQEVWVEHQLTKKRRKIVVKNGTSVSYPYQRT